jgi:hypothetical protein
VIHEILIKGTSKIAHFLARRMSKEELFGWPNSWDLDKGAWSERRTLTNTKGLLDSNTCMVRELQPLITVEDLPKMTGTLHGPIWRN